MALHSLYCADVPLRNCSLTHSKDMRMKAAWGVILPTPWTSEG